VKLRSVYALRFYLRQNFPQKYFLFFLNTVRYTFILIICEIQSNFKNRTMWFNNNIQYEMLIYTIYVLFSLHNVLFTILLLWVLKDFFFNNFKWFWCFRYCHLQLREYFNFFVLLINNLKKPVSEYLQTVRI